MNKADAKLIKQLDSMEDAVAHKFRKHKGGVLKLVVALSNMKNEIAMESTRQMHECINERGSVDALLRTSRKANGKVMVWHWGRDCDGVEASGVTEAPSSYYLFNKWADEWYYNAEGPCSLDIVTEAEAGEIESTWKDTFAEAAGY